MISSKASEVLRRLAEPHVMAIKAALIALVGHREEKRTEKERAKDYSRPARHELEVESTTFKAGEGEEEVVVEHVFSRLTTPKWTVGWWWKQVVTGRPEKSAWVFAHTLESTCRAPVVKGGMASMRVGAVEVLPGGGALDFEWDAVPPPTTVKVAVVPLTIAQGSALMGHTVDEIVWCLPEEVDGLREHFPHLF